MNTTVNAGQTNPSVAVAPDGRFAIVWDSGAMPGDLEKQIDVQQMADLLEYVKTTH